jgi:sugar phosphate isomerase/epimerase
MINRRLLLQSTFAAAALTNIRPASSFGAITGKYAGNIGLQLYTLRNQMATKPTATLQAVKDAGYAQVELMDVNDADTMVPLAKEHGLDVTSSFISWEILGNPSAKNIPTLQATIDKAAKHKLRYLVFGYIGKGHRETADQYKAMADRSNAAGEACKVAGVQLCYHHHSFEFQKLESGKPTTGFDVFVERFSPELMQFEIDVFWAAIGGHDPVDLLQKLEGRVAQVHLKDLLPGTANIFDEGKVPNEAFKEVGSGNINMAKVIEAAQSIGVCNCHVEQDQSPSPLDSIAKSMSYLKA